MPRVYVSSTTTDTTNYGIGFRLSYEAARMLHTGEMGTAECFRIEPKKPLPYGKLDKKVELKF